MYESVGAETYDEFIFQRYVAAFVQFKRAVKLATLLFQTCNIPHFNKIKCFIMILMVT